MRHLLALIVLSGLVWSASAKLLVYQNAYKNTFEYWVNTESDTFEQIKEVYNEIYVIEVDDVTGEVLGGFAYAYGVTTEHGSREKFKWATLMDDFKAADFRVVPLDQKQAIVVLWGNEPNLAKLKDGVVVSAIGAFSEASQEGDQLYVCADTSKLRLDTALTKKVQAADDAMAVIEAYLHQKGYLQE